MKQRNEPFEKYHCKCCGTAKNQKTGLQVQKPEGNQVRVLHAELRLVVQRTITEVSVLRNLIELVEGTHCLVIHELLDELPCFMLEPECTTLAVSHELAKSQSSSAIVELINLSRLCGFLQWFPCSASLLPVTVSKHVLVELLQHQRKTLGSR
jgi:hypothetical protein